jgi:putative peptidoglycan lipid II flippase
MALNVVLSLTLPRLFASASLEPYGGLALANSLATLLEFAVLLALIQRRLNGIERRRMARTIAKSSLAALMMALTLRGWQALLPDAGALIRGGGGIVVGLGTYLVGALLLRCEELQAIAGIARQRRGS